MRRALRSVLLVIALVWAQHAALLHALEHAAHEASIATLDHEIEKCVAYDAVGHALDAKVLVALESAVAFHEHDSLVPFPSFPARIVFASRAPPYSA